MQDGTQILPNYLAGIEMDHMRSRWSPDGLHMSTHASALLLPALAYSYARRHADDARFSFGTGKLAISPVSPAPIVLAMIAVLTGCEALTRFVWPIDFEEATPIAALGLAANPARRFRS